MNDNKDNKPRSGDDSPSEPKTYSAFPGKKNVPASGGSSSGDAKGGDGKGKDKDAPIPSQPRSFEGFSWRKKGRLGSAKPNPVAEKRHDFSSVPKPEDAEPAESAPAPAPTESPAPNPASADSAAADTSTEKAPETPVTIQPVEEHQQPANPAPAAAAPSAKPEQPPQSSGAGGDTIRLRINPKSGSRTFSTSGKSPRKRLPDIRRRGSAPVAGEAVRYGPFSLMFGFIWLTFKMLFFTFLMMGIGAGIGYLIMTAYIKSPEVTVPNIAGMKVQEAFEVLSEKQLGIKKISEESSGLVAPGEIISQNPAAGSISKEGAVVGVVISSGRSKFIVPTVVSESRENAINKIKGAGLEVGNILYMEDATIPKDHVVSQNPAGETGLDEPESVQLMVSSGPPGKSLRMPDLSGRTVIEARAALKALGINDVEFVPANAADDATVENQDPLVGKTIFQNDKVTLTTK